MTISFVMFVLMCWAICEYLTREGERILDLRKREGAFRKTYIEVRGVNRTTHVIEQSFNSRLV